MRIFANLVCLGFGCLLGATLSGSGLTIPEGSIADVRNERCAVENSADRAGSDYQSSTEPSIAPSSYTAGSQSDISPFAKSTAKGDISGSTVVEAIHRAGHAAAVGRVNDFVEFIDIDESLRDSLVKAFDGRGVGFSGSAMEGLSDQEIFDSVIGSGTYQKYIELKREKAARELDASYENVSIVMQKRLALSDEQADRIQQALHQTESEIMTLMSSDSEPSNAEQDPLMAQLERSHAYEDEFSRVLKSNIKPILTDGQFEELVRLEKLGLL